MGKKLIMKASEAQHLLQSDPRYAKNRYYAEQLAKHLFGMPDYELREMLEKITTADDSWELEKFIDHIDSSPACSRLRLLLTKLMENSCCFQTFIASLLAGIVCFRIQQLLGANPNVSLH